jgi:hypothetical protein
LRKRGISVEGLCRRIDGMFDAPLSREETLWAAIRDLFEEDDRSVPEVQIVGATAAHAQQIIDALIEIAPSDGDQMVYDHDAWGDETHRLRDVPDLGERAMSGTFCNRLLFYDLAVGGVELPMLGVWIVPALVAVDFWKGDEWTPEVLAAFIDLLLELQALAPGSELVAADEPGTPLPPDVQARFRRAVQTYAADR